MHRKFSLIIIALFLAVAAISQKISYDVSFPNIAHHEARITVTLTGCKTDTTIFRMSRSSPGRYATHEFAKNVYDVSAQDGKNKALKIDRFKTDEYSIAGKHDIIKLSYTLYGHYADGTYSDIDLTYVLLNMPASLMWVKGYENAPIELNFQLPTGSNWTIATQLIPGADAHSFKAPDLQYLMDSPVLMGDLIWRNWQVQNPNNKTYEIRLALNAGKLPDERVDRFVNNLKKVIAEQQQVFGELPDYDNGTYTFLASIQPEVHGDGMEHRNSTCITRENPFSETQLNTFSHEFFHCWNVERIRPADIEPFDFTSSDVSDALWFAEGFTQYYSRLMMVRAGLSGDDIFRIELAQWVNAKNATSAARQYSPVEMSRYAVFADAATSIDETNKANVFTSYYTYGAAIALALDMELRTRFAKSLDELMKQMWLQYGKKEIPYQLNDIKKILSGISNTAYADSFFNRYIYGHEFFDYEPLLKQFGFVYNEKRALWIGDITAATESSPNGVHLKNPSLKGSPLYEAGIDIDDVITSFDGKKVTTVDDLNQLLSKHEPGDVVSIEYTHRSVERKTDIKIDINPRQNIFSQKNLGPTINPETEAFRKQWLGSKAQ